MTTPPVRLVGLDVGTSAVKATAFDGDGNTVTTVREPMPELRRVGRAVTQPLEAIAAAVDRAVAELAGCEPRESWQLVALTGQRDTFTLLPREGAEREVAGGAELVFRRDRRDADGTPLVDILLGEGATSDDPEPPDLVARSIISWLAERFTGHAAETAGTRPRHMSGDARARVVERLGSDALPEEIRVGSPVGLWDGTPLHLTSGDRNCELVGSGVVGHGRAGLSLGSAIVLGMVVQGEPTPQPGVIVTGAALEGRRNVETGLLVGMEGEERLAALAGDAFTGDAASIARDDVEPRFREVPVCVPWFAEAMDGAGAEPTLRGVTPATTAADIHQAWAQGVVAELDRLLPALERAANDEIREIVLAGPGATDNWVILVADGLGVSVRHLDDPWRGARGAVICALLGDHDPRAHAFIRVANRTGVTVLPDEKGFAASREWVEEYGRAVAEAQRGVRRHVGA